MSFAAHGARLRPADNERQGDTVPKVPRPVPRLVITERERSVFGAFALAYFVLQIHSGLELRQRLWLVSAFVLLPQLLVALRGVRRRGARASAIVQRASAEIACSFGVAPVEVRIVEDTGVASVRGGVIGGWYLAINHATAEDPELAYGVIAHEYGHLVSRIALRTHAAVLLVVAPVLCALLPGPAWLATSVTGLLSLAASLALLAAGRLEEYAADRRAAQHGGSRARNALVAALSGWETATTAIWSTHPSHTERRKRLLAVEVHEKATPRLSSV